MPNAQKELQQLKWSLDRQVYESDKEKIQKLDDESMGYDEAKNYLTHKFNLPANASYREIRSAFEKYNELNTPDSTNPDKDSYENFNVTERIYGIYFLRLVEKQQSHSNANE